MTHTQFLAALDVLHWTQRGLAAMLGVNPGQVRRWATGEYEPPESIAEWLKTLAAFHLDNPPPERVAKGEYV